MAKRKRPQGNPAKRAWVPMRPVPPNPAAARVAGDKPPAEAWYNDLYQASVTYYDDRLGPDGPLYISFKRHDRSAVRDWRHFQQVKNDITGLEREAVELFPAESRLMDTSNQYHLFVLPTGERFPFGVPDGAVTDDEQVELFNGLGGLGRQRPWQPGLTTGRNEHTPVADSDDARQMMDALRSMFGGGLPR